MEGLSGNSELPSGIGAHDERLLAEKDELSATAEEAEPDDEGDEEKELIEAESGDFTTSGGGAEALRIFKCVGEFEGCLPLTRTGELIAERFAGDKTV